MNQNGIRPTWAWVDSQHTKFNRNPSNNFRVETHGRKDMTSTFVFMD